VSDVRVRLGSRIRQIRLGQAKTQEELGERAGLSYKQIGEIERGRANPELETLEKLANGLGVPLAEFFSARGEHAYPELETQNPVVRELKSRLQGALEVLNRAERQRAPRRRRTRS
jgi:transcriptional regulator with XRE-family HTH domain